MRSIPADGTHNVCREYAYSDTRAQIAVSLEMMCSARFFATGVFVPARNTPGGPQCMAEPCPPEVFPGGWRVSVLADRGPPPHTLPKASWGGSQVRTLTGDKRPLFGLPRSGACRPWTPAIGPQESSSKRYWSASAGPMAAQDTETRPEYGPGQAFGPAGPGRITGPDRPCRRPGHQGLTPTRFFVSIKKMQDLYGVNLGYMPIIYYVVMVYKVIFLENSYVNQVSFRNFVLGQGRWYGSVPQSVRQLFASLDKAG